MPNPGKGGWGVYARSDCGYETDRYGGHDDTTNIRMELSGAIEGLKLIQELNPERAEIITDSMYVKEGITSWIDNWVSNGWKKIKNRDLWEELYELNKNSCTPVSWSWVKGHSGDEGNERADRLASLHIEDKPIETLEKEDRYDFYLGSLTFDELSDLRDRINYYLSLRPMGVVNE